MHLESSFDLHFSAQEFGTAAVFAKGELFQTVKNAGTEATNVMCMDAVDGCVRLQFQLGASLELPYPNYPNCQDLCVDCDGNILVAQQERIDAFSTDGVLLRTIFLPKGLTFACCLCAADSRLGMLVYDTEFEFAVLILEAATGAVIDIFVAESERICFSDIRSLHLVGPVVVAVIMEFVEDVMDDDDEVDGTILRAIPMVLLPRAYEFALGGNMSACAALSDLKKDDIVNFDASLNCWVVLGSNTMRRVDCAGGVRLQVSMPPSFVADANATVLTSEGKVVLLAGSLEACEIRNVRVYALL